MKPVYSALILTSRAKLRKLLKTAEKIEFKNAVYAELLRRRRRQR